MALDAQGVAKFIANRVEDGMYTIEQAAELQGVYDQGGVDAFWAAVERLDTNPGVADHWSLTGVSTTQLREAYESRDLERVFYGVIAEL